MTEADQTSYTKTFPKIYYRLLAYLLDLLLILVICTTFFPLSHLIEKMGYWAWIPSTFVFVLYFLILERHKGAGQSIGKKLLGVQLIYTPNRKASFLNVSTRAALLYFPFLTVAFKSFFYRPHLEVMLIVLFWVIIIGETFFPIFHRQKRTLLDIICGSFLVKKTHVNTSVSQCSPNTKSFILSSIVLIFVMAINFNIITIPKNKYPDTHYWIESNITQTISNEAGIEFRGIYYYQKHDISNKLIGHLDVMIKLNYLDFSNQLVREKMKSELIPIIKKHITSDKIDIIRFNIIAPKYIGLLPLKSIQEISDHIVH